MVVGGSLGKKSLRVCKSVTKGYSNAQSKTRNATKNDPTLPTSRELNEIADLTFNSIDFIEIMEIIDKRLNDKGKLWRHVYKALTLLEHLLYWGADNVIRYCQDNLYVIKTLREFQYIDDNAVDQGLNVRIKAKDITNLLLNPNLLKSKRRRGKRRSYDVDDLINSEREREHERERAKSMSEPKKRKEDEDLQRAIQMSREEEERRRNAVENSNNGGLFNDLEGPKKESESLIDLSDINISSTSTLPLQVQYTSVQPQYTQMPLQAQYTQMPGPNQMLQPQYTQYTQFEPQYTFGQAQEAMQAEYLRQQAEWSAQQQQAQMLQYQQQMEAAQQQAQQMPQIMVPEPTGFTIGSNNPFAAGGPSPSPSLSTASTTSTSFSSSSRMSPATPFSARSVSSASHRTPSAADDKHAQLAGLFAGRAAEGDGVDTFGNTGFLRYGPTDTGRITAAKTGNGNASAGYIQTQRTAVF